MLEHHAHLLTDFVDVAFIIRNGLAFKDDFSAGRCLQQVQAAQESGFSAAAGSDQHNTFALVDVLADALEHLQIAKALGQVFNVYHLRAASSQRFPAAR